MSSKSKTNPRRRPATWADVEKALNAGRLEGVEYAITTLLWTLMDKHDAPTEDIMQLKRELEYLWDSIAKGYVSFAEIKKHLDKEYQWNFVWK